MVRINMRRLAKENYRVAGERPEKQNRKVCVKKVRALFCG